MHCLVKMHYIDSVQRALEFTIVLIHARTHTRTHAHTQTQSESERERARERAREREREREKRERERERERIFTAGHLAWVPSLGAIVPSAHTNTVVTPPAHLVCWAQMRPPALALCAPH